VPSGRSLCLDVGERRIGVAVSDAEGVLASPLTVVERREADRDFRQIAELVRREDAARVVIGLPRTLAGEIGPQARQVQRWAERAAAYLDVPLVFADERYSTVEAARRLAGGVAGRDVTARRGGRSPGRARRRGATPIDAAAAAVILQDYLDGAP
jgi:putative Holliday junction resolvase